LGLTGDVTEASLDTLSHLYEEERELRRTIDEADHAVAAAHLRRDEIDTALQALADQGVALEGAAWELISRCGIATPVDPAAVTATVATLRRGAEPTAAGRRISAEIT